MAEVEVDVQARDAVLLVGGEAGEEGFEGFRSGEGEGIGRPEEDGGFGVGGMADAQEA